MLPIRFRMFLLQQESRWLCALKVFECSSKLLASEDDVLAFGYIFEQD